MSRLTMLGIAVCVALLVGSAGMAAVTLTVPVPYATIQAAVTAAGAEATASATAARSAGRSGFFVLAHATSSSESCE